MNWTQLAQSRNDGSLPLVVDLQHEVLLKRKFFFLLLLSVALPVANALDVLQPCGLLYYP